jgi:hypothetical protein
MLRLEFKIELEVFDVASKPLDLLVPYSLGQSQGLDLLVLHLMAYFQDLHLLG